MRSSALPVVLALLSALASAGNLVLQRESSRVAPAGLSWWRLLWHLVRQPTWLAGEGSWWLAFALQALALHFGPMSVVQPVLVTEVVFVLLLRRLVMHWPVRGAAWGSAALLCGSLGLFLLAAEPHGGHPVPTTAAWVVALLVLGGSAAVAALLGRRGTPGRRAAAFAVSAAILAALEAALIKSTAHELSAAGLLALLDDWQVYALVVSGTASGLLVQAALHAGPLTVSQPLLVVVNPLVSIGLSVWLFGEHLHGSPATTALTVCALVGLVVGVVALTRTGPQALDVRTSPI